MAFLDMLPPKLQLIVKALRLISLSQLWYLTLSLMLDNRIAIVGIEAGLLSQMISGLGDVRPKICCKPYWNKKKQVYPMVF